MRVTFFPLSGEAGETQLYWGKKKLFHTSQISQLTKLFRWLFDSWTYDFASKGYAACTTEFATI